MKAKERGYTYDGKEKGESRSTELYSLYVCMVTHIAIVVWINRVRLPILHVVS